MSRAFGDWTRRQSAAVDTHHHYLPPAIDPRISERQQLLERILETTRWPTKHNVAADVDPDNTTHHFIPIQQLAHASPKDQRPHPQEEVVSPPEEPEEEVSDEAVMKRNLMFLQKH